MASPQGELLAHTARTWGQRPSAMLGLTDPVVAYALDEALALVLRIREMEARQSAKDRRHDPPPGTRFAADADHEDDDWVPPDE